MTERMDRMRPARGAGRFRGVIARAVCVGLMLVLPGLGPVAAEPGEQVEQRDQAEQGEQFSKANRLLFFSDHLQGVREGSVIRYDFIKSQPTAERFQDTVELHISRPAATQGATVNFRYLSGPRAREIPPIENATGNPILLLFLQHDAYEMARSSGGSVRHFQNRIKLALEQSAELTPVSLELNGRKVAGTRIRIAPYLDDPYRERFADQAGKVYDFVLSEAVPGGIYALTTTLSADHAQNDAERAAGSEPFEIIRYLDVGRAATDP